MPSSSPGCVDSSCIFWRALAPVFEVGGDRLRPLLGERRRALGGEPRADGGLHLLERRAGGGALLLHLDQVVAEFGLHRPHHLADRGAEGGLIEGGHHAAAAEPAEVAAALGVAAVGRHRGRHLGEVLAGVEPLLRHRRLGLGLDQDVAGVDLLGLLVLLPVLGVVVAQLGLAGRERLLDLRLVDEQVVGDALLGDAVLLAVLVEEALQLGVGDLHRAAGEGDGEVAHLRLLHLLAVAVLDVLVGDHHRALERAHQPLQHELLADGLLEGLGGVAEAAHRHRVALGADELALAVLEHRQVDDVAAQLAVGDLEVEVARLRQQDLVGDQAIERLLGQLQLLGQLLVVLLAELLPHLLVEALLLALVLHEGDRLAADRRRRRVGRAAGVVAAATEVDEDEEDEDADDDPEDPGQVFHRVAKNLQHGEVSLRGAAL
ncbi:MAG TPA: hypothetical protein VN923_00475 [Thermoanaerobaculia bacterium]|nr:hypothetical protein [Thermoanaerobaculia bacterium]